MKVEFFWQRRIPLPVRMAWGLIWLVQAARVVAVGMILTWLKVPAEWAFLSMLGANYVLGFILGQPNHIEHVSPEEDRYIPQPDKDAL